MKEQIHNRSIADIARGGRRRLLLLFLLVLWGSPTLHGQDGLVGVLQSIEQNNSTLKALREQADAQKAGNKTGIYLPGPEVAMDYFRGSPAAVGNRTDISVKQTFDIATVMNIKNRVADRQNEMLDWQFRAHRTAILQEAALAGIEIIYYNQLKMALAGRLHQAETLAAGYAKRLAAGDASILEYNKAQFNLAAVQGEIDRVEVERDAMIAELQRLNGGIALVPDDDTYGSNDSLPADFDVWFAEIAAGHPAIAYAQAEVALGKQNITLNKMQNWPAVSIGFVSENVVGQRYQGISFGLSVPLWENKNRVRQAAVAVRAAESRQADVGLQLHSRLRTAFFRAQGLRNIADDYRKARTSLSNTELLKKALDTGELSLLAYMVEMELYYTALQQTLTAERDYRKALIELRSIEW
ncbi:MAG: TolC family protein [Prevotellaceae bacterium]|jgi:outer membrane protein TolC|nr:TolC family protein [Prevotellaceae bacterium]